MPAPRPWREAILVLAAAGWPERDIAAAVGVSLGTVCRVLGIRFWKRPPPSLAALCSQRVGKGWCDTPVRPGQVYCDQHWRPGWPQ
jgi:hypothetical protein